MERRPRRVGRSLLCVGLACGFATGLSLHHSAPKTAVSGILGANGGWSTVAQRGAEWLGLVGHGCRQALDIALRLSVQAAGAPGGLPRQVEWACVARLPRWLGHSSGGPSPGFFNVDLVGAVGTRCRGGIAGAVITVFSNSA